MASSKESDDTLKSEKKSNVFVPFDSGDEIELPKKEIYLLGECTHGTQEFYDIRAEISMELVRERGVKVLVFEADWSLMWRCNEYVQKGSGTARRGQASQISRGCGEINF